MKNPAIIKQDNGKYHEEWRNRKGQLHRQDDKPAIIYYNPNGKKECAQWYINGDLCRENNKSEVVYYHYIGKKCVEEHLK